MQPRPLSTNNRMLRATGADQLRVSLSTAVSELSQTPMTGTLISRSLEQAAARYDATTEKQRQQLFQADIDFYDRLNRQRQVNLDLDVETDPQKRDELNLELEALAVEDEGQRSIIEQQSIDEGRYKSVEYLSEKYGDLLEFDRAMPEEEVKLLYQGKKEELIRQAIVDRSPSGLFPSVAKFGGGMLAMATDPVELASMFIPFVGPAGRAASIARFGRIGGRARVGAIEGTLGSLAAEPLYYSLSQSQQLDYTMSEALFNVGAGLFLGGGIGSVAGLLTRSEVNVGDVIKSVEPEVSVRTDLEPVKLPEKITEAEAMARADRVVKQTRDMYNITGGRVTYETAIRQFVTDQNVNVAMVLPKAPGRPTTLSEFVRSRGGINDNDPTFRGELKNIGLDGTAGFVNKKGTMVNRISNTKSKLNLDDMAELAEEAGYLDRRNTNDLIEALAEETRDNFTFSRQDLQQAEDWRDHYRAASDFEAEVNRREDIRAELEEFNIKEVSDEEIAVISQQMAGTNKSASEVYYQTNRAIEEVRAEMSANHGLDMRNDPVADFDFAARVDAIDEDVDSDVLNDQYESMIFEMRRSDELTDEQLKELDEIEKLDAEAAAYVEVVEAATVCIARS